MDPWSEALAPLGKHERNDGYVPIDMSLSTVSRKLCRRNLLCRKMSLDVQHRPRRYVFTHTMSAEGHEPGRLFNGGLLARALGRVVPEFLSPICIAWPSWITRTAYQQRLTDGEGLKHRNVVQSADADDVPGDSRFGPFVELRPIAPHLCGWLELVVPHAVVERHVEPSLVVSGHNVTEEGS